MPTATCERSGPRNASAARLERLQHLKIIAALWGWLLQGRVADVHRAPPATRSSASRRRYQPWQAEVTGHSEIIPTDEQVTAECDIMVVDWSACRQQAPLDGHTGTRPQPGT